ncbi:MAG: phospho-sugar mutase [Mycoplasmoidaceae bacterium]
MNKIYEKWLASEKVSQTFKDEMKAYSDDEIALYFSDVKPAFGTAGIRQKIGPGTKQFNEFTYKQLAIGFAKYLNGKYQTPKIIIGHDNRRFSSEFTIICAEVFSSYGIEVYLIKDNELKATPIISYLIPQLKLNGGIIITASHNPKEYNGFKVYKDNGAQILNDIADAIITNMPENDQILEIEYNKNLKLIHEVDQKYVDQYFIDAQQCLINTKVSEEKTFPIIFTAHHGTAYKDLPYFLRSLGYKNLIEVKEQCFPSDEFVNSISSNPEDEISFKLSLEYAEKHNANVMLGVDPDADRLAVVVRKKDGKFKYVSGNEMGIIFSYYCLKNKRYQKPPFIVSTFVSTNIIDRIAKDYDCKVFRTGTGFKWLAKAIDEHYNDMDLVVAFEEAIGSLNSTINRDKDSFQASALALEIFDHYQKKGFGFDEILEEIYEQYGFWKGETISFWIQDLNWVQKSVKIMEHLKALKMESFSGFKLMKNNWNFEGDCLEWFFEDDMTIKFRRSGTEPKFKAYLNIYGKTSEEAENNFENFKKDIKKLIESI